MKLKNKKEKFSVIIYGNGMYVSGRGTKNYGTILPGIFEFQRLHNKIDKIIIIGTNKKHSHDAKIKANKLSNMLGIKIPLIFYPNSKKSKSKLTQNKLIYNVDKPSCAIVSVPDHLHFNLTLNCLKNKFHTLVVKPLTSTLSESKKLANLAKKNNLLGTVEFHKRLDRQNLMIRDYLKSGKLGKILYSVVEYSQRKSIPSKHFKSWVRKTNILQYLGTHYIDLMHFFTRAKPIRVMAIGQKEFLKSKKINVHDSIQCTIEWKIPGGEKFTQTILTNWIDPETTSAMSDQKIKIIGTKGRFEADQKKRGLQFIVDKKKLEEPNPDFCHSFGYMNKQIKWEGYGIDSIVSFLTDVNSIIIGKNSPKYFEKIRPTFNDVLITTSIIQSAKKSLLDNSKWKSIIKK